MHQDPKATLKIWTAMAVMSRQRPSDWPWWFETHVRFQWRCMQGMFLMSYPKLMRRLSALCSTLLLERGAVLDIAREETMTRTNERGRQMTTAGGAPLETH